MKQKLDPLDPSKRLRQFIENWNNLYPIDRWWREKHRVAFGSKQHREQSMLDMRLEYEEDFVFAERNQRPLSSEYEFGSGKWLKPTKRPIQTQKQIDRDFDKIDLDEIQKAVSHVTEDGKKQITF